MVNLKENNWLEEGREFSRACDFAIANPEAKDNLIDDSQFREAVARARRVLTYVKPFTASDKRRVKRMMQEDLDRREGRECTIKH